jgi:hypothetical protein
MNDILESKTVFLNDLKRIPGVGKSIAVDLWNINIRSVDDLKGQNPQTLYDLSNEFADEIQDRCLLYVFRCAVYFAETPEDKREFEMLKWWNWSDKNLKL